MNARFEFSSRLRCCLALVAASSLIGAGELSGQENLATTLAALRPGQVVRVQTLSGDRVVATLDSLQQDPLALWLADQPDPFEAATLDWLWRQESGVGNGAALGAAIGGGLAFALSTASCYLATSIYEGRGCNAWGIVMRISVGGAAAGGMLGALIGSASPQWRLLYARDASVDNRLEMGPERGFGVALRFRH